MGKVEEPESNGVLRGLEADLNKALAAIRSPPQEQQGSESTPVPITTLSTSTSGKNSNEGLGPPITARPSLTPSTNSPPAVPKSSEQGKSLDKTLPPSTAPEPSSDAICATYRQPPTARLLQASGSGTGYGLFASISLTNRSGEELTASSFGIRSSEHGHRFSPMKSFGRDKKLGKVKRGSAKKEPTTTITSFVSKLKSTERDFWRVLRNERTLNRLKYVHLRIFANILGARRIKAASIYCCCLKKIFTNIKQSMKAMTKLPTPT